MAYERHPPDMDAEGAAAKSPARAKKVAARKTPLRPVAKKVAKKAARRTTRR